MKDIYAKYRPSKEDAPDIPHFDDRNTALEWAYDKCIKDARTRTYIQIGSHYYEVQFFSWEPPKVLLNHVAFSDDLIPGLERYLHYEENL